VVIAWHTKATYVFLDLINVNTALMESPETKGRGNNSSDLMMWKNIPLISRENFVINKDPQYFDVIHA
jgi:hypothetical protein